MTAVLPEGALVDVLMTVRLPRAATPEQVTAWLAVMVAGLPSMMNDNPLRDEEPIPFAPDDFRWADTGVNGREVGLLYTREARR